MPDAWWKHFNNPRVRINHVSWFLRRAVIKSYRGRGWARRRGWRCFSWVLSPAVLWPWALGPPWRDGWDGEQWQAAVWISPEGQEVGPLGSMGKDLGQEVGPRGSMGKESACQCRRPRRWGSNPWVGKIPLEEEMAPHSSILAWRIPWILVESGV